MTESEPHIASHRDDDWFAQSVRAHQERGIGPSPTPEWTIRRHYGKDPAVDLRVLRDLVRNLVRVHGVGKECRVELAVLGQAGAGATVFEGAPRRFDKPVIYLDKDVYETCDRRLVRDVYCGLGIHEAGHVLHTRRFFCRKPGDVSPRQRMWENLLEDARIEELARQDSPGFGGFLDATRQELLERGELGQALANWDSLPDLDKLRALTCAFIRCPHLIAEAHAIRTWRTIHGETVFDTLRAILRAAPQSEADVERYAAALEAMHERIEKSYAGSGPGLAMDDRTDETDSTGPDGASTPRPSGPARGADRPPRDAVADEALRRQSEADREDRRFDREHGHGSEPPRADASATAAALRLAEKLAASEKPDSESPPDLLEAMLRLEETEPANVQRLLEEAARLEREADRRKALAGRQGRRFGAAEMERMLDRYCTVNRPLDLGETAALVRADRERVRVADCWEWDADRRTVIRHPLPDAAARGKYLAARDLVRGHVAAMRRVFRLRLGTRSWRETERREGRLHRRMLGRAAVTDRLYFRWNVRRGEGAALCLLLDESGSMGACEAADEVAKPVKAAAALRVAALAAEALRGLPGVELEVYSHTSCGPDDRDCLVRYLFGTANPDPASIGAYGRGCQNYDHQAILAAADLFRENTANENRILLVVSDGQPAGFNYGGAPAVRAARDAVETVRRKGIRVMAVAIEDYNCEAIYGPRHVVKFTDLGQLVSDMRKLVVRTVGQATGD